MDDKKMSQLIDAWYAACAAYQTAEAEKKAASRELMQALDSAGLARYTNPDSGKSVVRVKDSVTTRLDTATFKAECPELYERYSYRTAKAGYLKK